MDRKLTLPASDFALTSTALEFMQNAYEFLEIISRVAGENVLISGGDESGGVADPGVIYIKGILMPFTGGAVQTNVRIITNTQTINVGVASREQTTYYAEFGTAVDPNDQVPWADIVKIDDIKTLMERITANEGNIQTNTNNIATNAGGISTNAGNIQANADAIALKADDKLVYAARIFETGTVTDSSNLQVFVNKDGFIDRVEHTSGDEFRLHFKNSDANWLNNLEIQATGILPSTSTKNRNPTFFFRDAAYASLYLIDTSGNSAGDGAFWIRIYKWN